MNLLIKTTKKIVVPAGTKIIWKDDWLTLARKKSGAYMVITLTIDQIGSIDFMNDDNWNIFTKKELLSIISKLK